MLSRFLRSPNPSPGVDRTSIARGWQKGLLACLAAVALPACAQLPAAGDSLPPQVLAALQRAGVPTGAMSALVVSTDTSAQQRLRHRAGASMNPASVMKLVTTYAAIDLLGPDYTWNTGFYTDGVVEQGVLRGNLYVRGGGDPVVFFLEGQVVPGQQQVGDLLVFRVAFSRGRRHDETALWIGLDDFLYISNTRGVG